MESESDFKILANALADKNAALELAINMEEKLRENDHHLKKAIEQLYGEAHEYADKYKKESELLKEENKKLQDRCTELEFCLLSSSNIDVGKYYLDKIKKIEIQIEEKYKKLMEEKIEIHKKSEAVRDEFKNIIQDSNETTKNFRQIYQNLILKILLKP